MQKLGARCLQRIQQFRHSYDEGWGDGKGKPLSHRALESLYRFLEVFDFPEGKKPSVFLTDQGGLELVWEDSLGKSVQVEFRPNEVE